jgi:threonine/homoserine/homoserine lactone efflux protein
MCAPQVLFAFVVACAALILTPGPSQALILSRTLEGGRAAGMFTAVGINAATLVHAAAAGLGLSAVLAQSALAFGVLKAIGALYLIYLGIRTLLSAKQPSEAAAAAKTSRTRAVREAFLTGLLNPKVALFFLAFLPQFICPAEGWVLVQALVLGAILAVMDTVYAAVLVTLTSSATSWFSSPRAIMWRSRVTGAVLIALGVGLAFSERR